MFNKSGKTINLPIEVIFNENEEIFHTNIYRFEPLPKPLKRMMKLASEPMPTEEELLYKRLKNKFES